MQLIELAELYTAKARSTSNFDHNYHYVDVVGIFEVIERVKTLLEAAEEELQKSKNENDEDEISSNVWTVNAYKADQVAVIRFKEFVGENRDGYVLYQLPTKLNESMYADWLNGTPVKYFTDDQFDDMDIMIDFLNTFDLIKDHLEIK